MIKKPFCSEIGGMGSVREFRNHLSDNPNRCHAPVIFGTGRRKGDGSRITQLKQHVTQHLLGEGNVAKRVSP